jgi:ribosomal protein L12E/L44/L45/RPP1/RPP2
MRSPILSIVVTSALCLSSAIARPAPNPDQVAQISQLVQSAGLQGLSTTDLKSLLQNLNTQGAVCQNGAETGAGEGQGEGEAAAGEGEAEAGEGEAESKDTDLNMIQNKSTKSQQTKSSWPVNLMSQ